MTYVFDIDGTICSKTDGDYIQAQPNSQRIQRVNELYDEGHTIIDFYIDDKGIKDEDFFNTGN